MKKYLNRTRLYYLIVIIATVYTSCSKEPVTSTDSYTTPIYTPPPPPPPPPPSPIVFGQISLFPDNYRLPEPRRSPIVMQSRDVTVFAGGWLNSGWASDKVDIYNSTTDRWSNYSLNGFQPQVSCVCNDKIVFAGSQTGGSSPQTKIYNTSTNTWSTINIGLLTGYITCLQDKIFDSGGYYDLNTQVFHFNPPLSIERSDVIIAPAGNKVLYAGGITSYRGYFDFDVSRRIDVYDVTSRVWSTLELSAPRVITTAVVAINKIFFIGGYYDNGISLRTDVYDASNNSLHSFDIPLADSYFSHLLINDKIYIAQNGKLITIDINTYAVTIKSLRVIQTAPLLGFSNDKLLITGVAQDISNQPRVKNLDIYDTRTDSLSSYMMPYFLIESGIASTNNKILIAGGKTSDPGLAVDSVYKISL